MNRIENKKHLVFYNNYNNGDIHVSRNFIKDIIKKTNFLSYSYAHKNSKKLLGDIKELKISKDLIRDDKSLIISKDDIVYINTWYNPNYNHKKYGCTLRTLYENFKLIYDEMDLLLENYEYYIPNIDFEKFYISNINKFFETTKYKKFIYISNGDVLSGQSINFNFDTIINNLSMKYKNILFILSNNTSIKYDNVIESKDIINSRNNDLNENSYLTTKCDIIIGRNSGSATYSLIDDNLLKGEKQYFLSISNVNPFFVQLEYLKYNKKFVWLKTNNILPIIKEIDEFYGN